MSPQFRYTLYHEHLEGLYLLNKRNKVFMDEFRGKLQLAIDCVGLETQNTLYQAMKRRHNPVHSHFFALTIELALAKKEMSKDEYIKHLGDALRNRV